MNPRVLIYAFVIYTMLCGLSLAFGQLPDAPRPQPSFSGALPVAHAKPHYTPLSPRWTANEAKHHPRWTIVLGSAAGAGLTVWLENRNSTASTSPHVIGPQPVVHGR